MTKRGDYLTLHGFAHIAFFGADSDGEGFQTDT